MGFSTDALLFFGIDYGDECPFADGDAAYEAEQAWTAEYGPPKPGNTDDYHSTEWESWRRDKHEWEKTGTGITVSTHCSGDSPMYFVALTAFSWRACRGCPKEIDVAARPSEEQIAALRIFCQRHTLSWHEPRWLLASDCG